MSVIEDHIVNHVFIFFAFSLYTRGDQKVREKVLLNLIAFIDFNENS